MILAGVNLRKADESLEQRDVSVDAGDQKSQLFYN